MRTSRIRDRENGNFQLNRTGSIRLAFAIAMAFGVYPTQASAQHEHEMSTTSMMDGPLGVSHERMGSGTTWMPDNSVMHANHKMWGDWTVMLHGVAFGQYDYQGTKRGANQLGVVDWEMLMAMRSIGTGKLHLHGMVSLEPWTVGNRGYPLLLQTGESYKGQPLHDRQHPHDAVMELAAMFQQPIGRNLAIELYGGLAGEPAIGPVAFMHRPSAQSDPLAPLGHHWQDATHISFGVLTAGLYSKTWKVETSAFNGREPDENRWNLDLRRLDSYSARVTVNPVREWSLSGWYGYLASPEELHPDESVRRYGASAMHGGRGLRGGTWSSTLLAGVNSHGGQVAGSALAESNLEIGLKNSLFTRVEYVRKSAADLVLDGVDPERQFDVKSLVLGYVREIASIRGGTIGVGARGSVNFVPDAVGKFYGTNAPKGIDVFLRIRPKAMQEDEGMKGMDMSMPPSSPMKMPMSMPMGSDTSMKHEPMVMTHDSTMTHQHDSTMHHDSTMIMHHKSVVPTASKTTAAKHPVKKAVAKKPAKKSAKKPAAKKPAAKDPHAGHDMKGMKMPADTTRKKNP
jgi:hypothetical protein